tara:strand:+ start:666 stop:869 length:204 start_codon:yes stop_codon:yes gene_type:complete
MAEIICGRVPNCGFRVHDRYYEQKVRFTPGVCARCNGPLNIVADHTDETIQGVTMNMETGALVHPRS